MMKYDVPEINIIHFITDIEVSSSAIVTRYVQEARTVDPLTEAYHVREESIRDILSFTVAE